MNDIDSQIQQLRRSEYIKESEVKELCEKAKEKDHPYCSSLPPCHTILSFS